MKLTRSKWEVSLTGGRLDVRDYAIVSWARLETLMETWSRAGQRSREWETRQWRLSRGSVKVPDGEGES